MTKEADPGLDGLPLPDPKPDDVELAPEEGGSLAVSDGDEIVPGVDPPPGFGG